MPTGLLTITSLVHKIRVHGRRGKGMAESFSRKKLRQAPQKEGGWKLLLPSSNLQRSSDDVSLQPEVGSVGTREHNVSIFPVPLRTAVRWI
jgi:hypothetical protein